MLHNKSIIIGGAGLAILSVFAWFSIDHSNNPDGLDGMVDYNLHIRPILSDKCFDCHGPDAKARQAGLRLDIADSAYVSLKENPKMHAIECRINAEDPYNDFRPSPGKITVLHTPGGHGVRLDTHAYAGYTIPPNYDSMIAKLITVAQTREEAIAKMKRALHEFVIDGIKTTIPFHKKLMDDPDFVAGNYTTKFLESFDFASIE